MKPTRRKIAVRGSGTSLHFSADPITRTRLEFCALTLHRVLGLEVSHSTIIRRALVQYASSLTSVIEAQELAATLPDHMFISAETDPKTIKAKRIHAAERRAINEATKGDPRTLSTEQLHAEPIRSLKQLFNDLRSPIRRPIDDIKDDLARWASQTSTTEKAHDDF